MKKVYYCFLLFNRDLRLYDDKVKMDIIKNDY